MSKIRAFHARDDDKRVVSSLARAALTSISSRGCKAGNGMRSTTFLIFFLSLDLINSARPMCFGPPYGPSEFVSPPFVSEFTSSGYIDREGFERCCIGTTQAHKIHSNSKITDPEIDRQDFAQAATVFHHPLIPVPLGRK